MRILVTIALVLSLAEIGAQPAAHLIRVSDNQFQQVLAPYLATRSNQASSLPMTSTFLQKLERKRIEEADDIRFLQWMFSYTHKSFLHEYKEFAAFDELFSTRQYNCLTATIFLSTLLDHFQIAHQVIETNYHIFITVRTPNGSILIETTDSLNGFIKEPKLIEERLERYRENALHKSEADTDLAYYRYGFSRFDAVQPHELLGLLYYNLAAEAFNQNDLPASVKYLEQAAARYTSPRIIEFSTILLVAVHESQLQQGARLSLKKTLHSIRYQALPVANASASGF